MVSIEAIYLPRLTFLVCILKRLEKAKAGCTLLLSNLLLVILGKVAEFSITEGVLPLIN
jgi:hypothetical protein